MTNHLAAEPRSRLIVFALGLLVGILLGFASSLLFMLVIAGPFLGVVMGLIALRTHPRDPSRMAGSAGLLVGVGGVYLYGAYNTLVPCYGSSVCGGDSALPLLAWALLILAAGIAMGAVALRHRT
jgi:hypothetical protein